MKTYAQSYTDAQTFTGDTTVGTLTLLQQLINECIKNVLAMDEFVWFKSSATDTTVASQQAYKLPYNADRITGVKVVVGGVSYFPDEVSTGKLWGVLNRVTITSDIPQKYYVSNSSQNVQLYPTPSSSGNTMTFYFPMKIRDLSIANYTTGTVSTTAGSNTVTGAGTTFTAAMVGRYIQIDKFWYEITGFTSTTVITTRRAIGSTQSAVATLIAEMIPFPDGYENLPAWWASSVYFATRESKTAKIYKDLFDEGVAQLIRRNSKSVGLLEKDDITKIGGLVNINQYPLNLS